MVKKKGTRGAVLAPTSPRAQRRARGDQTETDGPDKWHYKPLAVEIGTVRYARSVCSLARLSRARCRQDMSPHGIKPRDDFANLAASCQHDLPDARRGRTLPLLTVPFPTPVNTTVLGLICVTRTLAIIGHSHHCPHMPACAVYGLPQ